MKIRRETKIGLLAFASIALLIWGYQYLKGISMFSTNTILYAEYDNVNGIRLSTPVFIDGLQVGLVSDLFQNPENPRRIVVEMNIDRDRKIPKDAVAEITVTSLMGEMAINLTYENPCSGPDCAQSGDYLKGITKGTLASMVGLDDVKAYMETINQGMSDLFKELEKEIKNNEKIGQTFNDLSATMANLKSLTGRMDRLMATSSGDLKNTLANVKSLTDTLNAGSSSMKSMIENADRFAAKMNDLPLDETLGEAKNTFAKLQNTLANADKMVAELNDLLTKAKSDDGAVAMLLSDPDFAARLKLTVQDMQLLLQDLRLHPKRYLGPLAKRKKYVKPEEDPGH
ncbi:MAG: MCE family protein [Bacteroidetes bacterium]|nr:MAG: MCE family protein [Bacteroidota bacterium]